MVAPMLTLDGSRGEGGGQILRSALALSLVTRTPFRIHAIRARRAKPGLMRQHLTAVRAAAEVSGATVTGDALASQDLTFHPGRVVPGAYTFRVGTAGSATLVLQTVLPALMLAAEPSSLTLEGGTHNPMAPPYDFLARSFLPLLARMGPQVDVALDRYGFHPAGGGVIRASILPVNALSRLDLPTRGAVLRCEAVARVAAVPNNVALRELAALGDALGWSGDALRPEVLDRHWGPGNVVTAVVESAHVTEVFTAVGERGVRAEAVGQRVADEVRRYLAADVPVGEHLADQLLLPMALAGGGSFRTLTPTDHATTHAEVLRLFTNTDVRFGDQGDGTWAVAVRGDGPVSLAHGG